MKSTLGGVHGGGNAGERYRGGFATVKGKTQNAKCEIWVVGCVETLNCTRYGLNVNFLALSEIYPGKS